MHSNHPQGQEARQKGKEGEFMKEERKDVPCSVTAPILVKSFHSTVNIFHLHARKHTQIWRHSHGLGNKHRDMKDAKGAFWGSVLAKLTRVDQEKSAHQVAFCNTHKASHSWLSMPLNLALKIKLLSCAVIVDIVGIIYANFKGDASLWILIVNDGENYSSQVEKKLEDWLG